MRMLLVCKYWFVKVNTNDSERVVLSFCRIGSSNFWYILYRVKKVLHTVFVTVLLIQ